MIQYAFEQRLVPLIQAGLVCQTFQPPSLRHARPGERIRLTDRQNFAAIIPDPVCFAVDRCEISWQAGRIAMIREAGVPLVNHRQFAKGLGFASVEELEAEFTSSYGASFIEGFIITWIAPTPAEMEVAA